MTTREGSRQSTVESRQSTVEGRGSSAARPWLTLDEFGRKLRAREISATEALDECLRRIEADDARLNAFILVMTDEARHQAREADRELAAGRDRGPLHGAPISIKDLFDIRGTPTTAASRVREHHRAERDAPAVVHLRQAGAVFVGKTNLHEFALGTTNEDSAFGPARNPHDASRSPGGSSGGSAITVAAGMALASVGSDTGGSIRIPAAACGVVGLKPTYGEVSAEGVVPLSRTLDHVGPLASTVVDAYLMHHALIGDTAPRPLAAAPRAGLRIGVLRDYFCDVLDDDVREQFDKALDRLHAAGARLRDVRIRHSKDIAPVYLHIVMADAAAYHAATLTACPERYTPPVRLRLEMGRHIMGEDYVRALNGRALLEREVDAALADADALLLPTMPIPAPPLGERVVRVGSTNEPVRNVMLRNTQLFNLTGHPAIALPAGRTGSGLPCSVQLVGARTRTDALACVALAVEQVLEPNR
jgi:aspartyl-tRNA(Asn)/glutamyl-tRNA(Gln) amidotransferase subunit A